MDYTQPRIIVVIASALLALVLQLVLAPAISIFGITPDFVMVIVILTAMHNSPLRSTLVGFLLGLIFDFCSLGSIGGMALVFTILGYGVSSLNKGVFTGGIIVDLIILVLAIIAGEFLISVIYAVVGANPDFLLSLLYRVLPGIAYDVICGFILLLIYNAISGNKPSTPSNGGGRSLSRKLSI